ncbi:apolipoprotein N-acyltransferase [Gayadomonas joobiniege]|uniref:apolipoprotein N-acyltransferase n=1 Tax=Gayadomonas joobiniege TaxID=1234606 RepID=UPI0003781A5A|nr:apolipoprotein N-acyltransferase [Gayadomonas joobiniege]
MKSGYALAVPSGLFAAGGTATLAFAPFSYYALVWFALPLIIYFAWQQPAKTAAAYLFSFSLGWFGIGLSWIHVSLSEHGGVPLIGSVVMIGILAAYLSIYFVLPVWLAKKASRYLNHSIYLIAPFWAGAEYLRSHVLTGFSWLSPGYSQIDSPFANLFVYFGETGVTFLMVLASCAIAAGISKARWQILAGLLMIALPVFLLPPPQTQSIDKAPVNLTLVQGNVAQENRWQPEYLWPTMLKYQDMSRPYYNESDIVIWPEAAVPSIEPNAQDYLINIDQAAAYNNTALVTGIIDYRPLSGEFFNSIIVLGQVSPEQTGGQYSHGHANRFNKHHLLPIGEFVPFEDLLRNLAPIFDLPFSSFDRGDYKQPPLLANGYFMTPALCYEILFSRQVRDNLTEQTDFILTLSNDAWFGRSKGPHQHLEIARMRALELGIPVIRSTNTGITAVIDEQGNVVKKAEQFIETVLRYQLQIKHRATFYRAYGDRIVTAMSFILLIFVLLLNRQRFKKYP